MESLKDWFMILSTKPRIIGMAAMLALFSWCFEAVFHYLVLREKTFLDSLILSPSPHAIYTRLNIMALSRIS